jgi:hypothetical protein
MPRHASTTSARSTAGTALRVLPQLGHETLYIGVDVGKAQHVAGFVSRTLLARYQRFESCPALSFAQSREGFRALAERIREYVPLTQVYVLLEVTGHYHRGLVQYLHELEIPVYLMHVQKRQAGLLKSDKRDALGLANHLYNVLEKGVQSGDPLQAVRRLVPPSAVAAQLAGMIHHRDELVRERTQRKNQLTAIYDELFPEFTQICKDPNAPSALALRAACGVADACGCSDGQRQRALRCAPGPPPLQCAAAGVAAPGRREHRHDGSGAHPRPDRRANAAHRRAEAH